MNLDGTLELAIINGFAPALGDRFRIMSFSSRSGVFGTVTGTSLGVGRSLDTQYGPTDVTEVVV